MSHVALQETDAKASPAPFFGKLFELNHVVDLVDLETFLADRGLVLNRAHRKENNGMGTTEQIMLVFQTGMSELPKADRRALLDVFTGDGRKIDGHNWKGRAYSNRAQARVPQHLFLEFGNAKKPTGATPRLDVKHDDFVLKLPGQRGLRPLTKGGMLLGVGMVRVAFNVYPDMARLIPDWVALRPRHADKTE
ncbi:MAG: hypothetical protein V4465_01205 [Patescibacteria group bacterium]